MKPEPVLGGALISITGVFIGEYICKFSAIFIMIPEPVLGGALISITGVFKGEYVRNLTFVIQM